MTSAFLGRFGLLSLIWAVLALPAQAASNQTVGPRASTPLARLGGNMAIPQAMIPVIKNFVQGLNAGQKTGLDPFLAKIILQADFDPAGSRDQAYLSPMVQALLSKLSADEINALGANKKFNFFKNASAAAREEYAEAVAALKTEIQALPDVAQMNAAQRQRMLELLFLLRRLEILSVWAEPKVATALEAANKALRGKVNPFMDEKIGGLLSQADQFVLSAPIEQLAGVYANAIGFQHLNLLQAFDPAGQNPDKAARDAALSRIESLNLAQDNLAQGVLVASLGAELKKSDTEHVQAVRKVLDKVAQATAFNSVHALFIQVLLGQAADSATLGFIQQITDKVDKAKDGGFLQTVAKQLMDALGSPQADVNGINALVLKLIQAAGPSTLAATAVPAQNATTTMSTDDDRTNKGPGLGARAWKWIKRLLKLGLVLVSLWLALGFFAPGFRSQLTGLVFPAAATSTTGTENPTENAQTAPTPEEIRQQKLREDMKAIQEELWGDRK